MARSKEFDPGDALDLARECFKRHGYAGASMATLTREMGIGRASLYATFGDKDRLYRAALESYVEATVAYMTQRLGDADNKVGAIRELLRDIARMASLPENRHGCLLINCTAELASTDADIRKYTAASFERIENAYCAALEIARERGEIDAAKDPRTLSRFLVATMQSLRIIGKTKRSPGVLDDVVETALLCLD